ncbi:MAG: glucose-6-phosphate isomerase [Geothermobacteraceae bacterium]
MGVIFDYTFMMADLVGSRCGIAEGELEALGPRAAKIHKDLVTRRAAGELPFYDLPFDRQMLELARDLGADLGSRFSHVVVLGIGGSALGTLALFRALAHPFHNSLPAEKRGNAPTLHVLDNVDPHTMATVLEQLEAAATVFLVISKSGSTVETSAQFLVACRWLTEQGVRWQDHVVAITDPEKGGLRELVRSQGLTSLPIPPGVGGRFSVFTPVGLLPLAAVGLDVERLLAGAAAMEPRVTREEFLGNPAYLNAALQFLAYRKGMPISVMMPYCDRLRDVADWYRQLWAESLGKRRDLDGREVFVGPTPVKALGTTDQHSQVQLYVEGPFDKVVTFLEVEDYDRNLAFEACPEAPYLDFLAGHDMVELIRAEQRATSVALLKAGRPSCSFILDRVSPENLGGLLYLLEVQTLFAGGLFGIDPLDQPGVEAGKEFTYGLMGRSGFEHRGAEVRELLEGVNRRQL